MCVHFTEPSRCQTNVNFFANFFNVNHYVRGSNALVENTFVDAAVDLLLLYTWLYMGQRRVANWMAGWMNKQKKNIRPSNDLGNFSI